MEDTLAALLDPGDLVLVKRGERIPADGEIVEGIACIDESAIEGRSARVLRDAEGKGSEVRGGTRVVSGWIVVRVTEPRSRPPVESRTG